jgi:predicted HTH transcriptional regulator
MAMLMIIQKPLASVTELDLKSLVTNAVEESDSLDYKLEMHASSDQDKKEMLHDVSAMANSRGGYILIGIREENEAAVEIIGIEQAELAAERILSSSLSGIHERINGLDAQPIPLASGRHILAIFVPPSTRMPHMV